MSVAVPCADDISVPLPWPHDRVGLLVGRNGETLRRVSDQSGCRVRVDGRGGARMVCDGRLFVEATVSGPRANVVVALGLMVALLVSH